MAANPLKRKRTIEIRESRSEAASVNRDDTDDDGSLATKKKVPLRKRSEGHTKRLAQILSDPVEGSSTSRNYGGGGGSARHKGRKRECVPPPLPSLERVSQEGLDNVAGRWAASEGCSQPNSIITMELSKAISHSNDLEEEIRRLREELVDCRRKYEREVRQIKQDMFLDMMLIKDAEKEVLQNLQIERARSRELHSELHRLQSHHKQRVTELELQITAQKDRLTQQEAEGYIIQLAAEHKDNVISTLEGDLDELRQIENEDRTRYIREHQSQELPPAYGSLDEEDQSFLRYAEKDSGIVEVAIFKRTVRSEFMNILVREMASVQERRRAASHPPETSVALCFLSLTEGLALAAKNIDDILKRSRDVATIHVRERLDSNSKLDKVSKTGRHTDIHVDTSSLDNHDGFGVDKFGSVDNNIKKTIRTEVGRHCFIADRFAKLILELTLQLVSTVEIFAIDIDIAVSYSRRHSVNAELSWTRIDRSLLEALRVALNGAERGADGITRSIKIQYYITWVQILSDRLESYKAKLGLNRFFYHSWQWLNEQLESARQDLYGDGSLLEELLEIAAASLNPLDQSCLRRHNRGHSIDSDALNSDLQAQPSRMITSISMEEDRQLENEMVQQNMWAIAQRFSAEGVEMDRLRPSEERLEMVCEGSVVSSKPSRSDGGEDTE